MDITEVTLTEALAALDAARAERDAAYLAQRKAARECDRANAALDRAYVAALTAAGYSNRSPFPASWEETARKVQS